MKEAILYKKLDEQKVLCSLCAHSCSIKPGERGRCGIRENRDGTLYSLVYGHPVARHVDPVEKKPLYHFYPGSLAYSIGTVGCNFNCLFCQNADIAQMFSDESFAGNTVPPEALVEGAQGAGCKSMAYTYNEPTVFMEYALDTGKIAQRLGLKNIFVSNGYMSRQALDIIEPYLDAANVDLKSFSDEFYSRICGAHLAPVLKTLESMKQRGIWLEVTTLVIPDENDDSDQLRKIAEFIRDLGEDTPWHVSAFFPTYRMTDHPPTPVSTVHKARDIGIEAGLNYVYTGNIPASGGENTYCPSCNALLIKRSGFSLHNMGMKKGACSKCGQGIPGVGMDSVSL